jgi:HAUS augmin-like complex subunit 3
LREALGKIEGCSGSEGKTVEQLRAEISCLGQSVSSLKTQLQSLNNIQTALSVHQAGLLKEREAVSLTHSHTLSSHQTALHTTQQDNEMVNSAVEELRSAVDDVISFHQHPQGDEGGDGEFSLFSHIYSEHYSSAEDAYLTELTAYTKKQFFQGIAVMAHTSGEEDEDGQPGLVDLNDPANILMRGRSSEQYSSHCQELTRLKNLYPVVESQRVSDILAEEYAEAVCRRAEELVTELRDTSSPLDSSLLRQHIGERQAQLSHLQSETSRLARQQLPDLIHDMATLEISTILHGDYSLKMARQDYFTSKQDTVISYLLSQTARQELLSMLYEVELRRHRDTHRLLSAAASQLLSWGSSADSRLEAMKSSSLQPVKEPRLTVDSRDKFALRMCSMLGVSASGPGQLLTHSSLERAVGQLVQQTASLEALQTALLSEQQHTVHEMVTISEMLGKQVFGGSSGQLQLSLKEYEEECSKLEGILSTMEQNIKKLLADFDNKKKCLQGNELIDRERRLFVYFFTDPAQLTREITELSRRVNAIATARKSAST